jgi:hypothetical protein
MRSGNKENCPGKKDKFVLNLNVFDELNRIVPPTKEWNARRPLTRAVNLYG